MADVRARLMDMREQVDSVLSSTVMAAEAVDVMVELVEAHVPAVSTEPDEVIGYLPDRITKAQWRACISQFAAWLQVVSPEEVKTDG